MTIPTLRRGLLAGLSMSALAMAQVTYVDANPATNTTLADGTPFVPVATANATDNLWTERTGFANGGSAFESNSPSTTGGEDAPMLRTTIGGLRPGFEYLVYSYFWGATNADWRGRTIVDTVQPTPELPGYNTVHFATSAFAPMLGLGAGLIGSAPQTSLNLTYDAVGVENEGHFAGQVLIQEGNRWLFTVPLGVHAADANGEIQVYVDDLAFQSSSSNRTWYDGVGYELAPQRFGNGCGTPTPPVIGSEGAPLYTTDFTVTLANAPANAAAVFAAGIDRTSWNGIPLPFAFAFIGFPNCDLNVAPIVTAGQVTDASGAAALTLNLGILPPLSLYWQGLVLGGGALSVTPGLETSFHR